MHTYAMFSGGPGSGSLHIARWRRHLEEDRRSRHAQTAGRQDRRGHRAQQCQTRLRPHPDRRPGIGLALRRWRRKLGRRQLAACPGRSRGLLHPPRRQPHQPRRSLRRRQQFLGLHRWRQEFPHAQLGRRYARYLDRCQEPQPHSGDSRWRHVHDHRSRADVQPRHPPHRPDVPRRRRLRRALQDLRQHAGRRHHARPQQRGGTRSQCAGAWAMPADAAALADAAPRATWEHNLGGCESGFTIPDPTDSNIVWASCYGNEVTRYDAKTKMARSVSPWLHTLDAAAQPGEIPLPLDGPAGHRPVRPQYGLLWMPDGPAHHERRCELDRTESRSFDQGSGPDHSVGRNRWRQSRPVLWRGSLFHRALRRSERPHLDGN